MTELFVWRGSQRIATLYAKKEWDLRCRYQREIVESGLANRPLLSCSLPVVAGRQGATPWVRGLLPEGQHLLALATAAGVPTNSFASLIRRYGRDVAGAFTIGSEPADETAWGVELYTAETLEEELAALVDAPGFGVRDDSELSIAGLQNKLLVCAVAGGWGRPVRGRPSTHILKLGDARYPGLVEAEHQAMQLARLVGLTTVTTEVLRVGSLEILAVERYDRAVDADGVVTRLHQEDSCQALGVAIDGSQGRGKYEEFGGPGFAAVAELLDRHGSGPEVLERLAQVAVFTYLVGNADAHGKNLSFLIDAETGDVDLAPLYDVVPTVLWPALRSTMAMSVNGERRAPTRDDFLREANTWGLGNRSAGLAIDDICDRLGDARSDIEHPKLRTVVADRLSELSR